MPKIGIPYFSHAQEINGQTTEAVKCRHCGEPLAQAEEHSGLIGHGVRPFLILVYHNEKELLFAHVECELKERIITP